MTEWVEGVTPTFTLCPHGVKILSGTYLRETVPTGDHPECLVVHENEMQTEADAYERERWDEHLRSQ